MPRSSVPSRSNGWRIAGAVLLVLVGLFVLAHTVVATTVSVLVVGWSALAAAALAVSVSLMHVGRRSFWFGASSGALSAGLGVAVLRDPHGAAETLTFIAGVLFLALGTLRLIAPADGRRARVLLVGTGLAYAALGVFVLSDVASASVALLGRIVGLQILLDGLSLLLMGKLRSGLRDPHHTTRSATPVRTVEQRSIS